MRSQQTSSSFLRPEKQIRGGLLHPQGYLYSSRSPTEVSSTPRVDLPLPIGVTGLRLHFRAPYEHKFHVTDESPGREAPGSAHSEVRHPPLHRTLEVRQRLGSQRVDSLGDTALRLRQAGDIGEHGHVALRGSKSVQRADAFVRGEAPELQRGLARCISRSASACRPPISVVH